MSARSLSITGRDVGYSNVYHTVTGKTTPANASASQGEIALPCRIDLMHGPVYRSESWSAPVRPGSEDHRRYASLGVRC